MFEFQCVNTKSWKLKIENWNLYVKCLESEILNTKMNELGCVNIWSWKLKFEMSEFGCVNTKSWKLKIKIWISLWNVEKESKILKIEISEYWKLKPKMFKY